MTDHPLTDEKIDELCAVDTDPARFARAAFDAGREHERTTLAEPLARTLLGVPEGHGAPHHDADQIRPGDFVVEVDEDGRIRGGIAHYQGADGDWRTKGGWFITYATRRADRPDALTIWPAPTQELTPERDGVVLIPADGHKAITTTSGQEFSRLTFTTKQSIWYGPNLAARPGDWVIQTTTPSRLTPGTWKVDEK